MALLLSAASLPAATLGALASRRLDGGVLMLLFATVMAASALAMLFRKGDGASGRPLVVWKMLPVGFGVGLVTGVVGAGGGFLIVPALVVFGGLAMQEAVGTSLVAITLNCAAGLVGKLGSAPVDWTLTLAFAAVAVGGSFLGFLVGRRVSPAGLRRVFAWFVLAIAAVILWQHLA